MIDINYLRSLAAESKIHWSNHAILRLHEHSISRADVIACIQNGVIIKQYPDDTPFPSCLILGKSLSEKLLHVVCSIEPEINCIIITTYYPDPDIWEPDFKIKKVVSK